MNRSRFLFCIASGLLACALVGPVAAQRKRHLRTVPSDAARQWLDSLTAGTTQSTAGGAVPLNGSATTSLPARGSVQPGKVSAPQMQADLLSSTSHGASQRKLSRRDKAKAIWQVAAGAAQSLAIPLGSQKLLGLPTDGKRALYSNPPFTGDSAWQEASTLGIGYPAAGQIYGNTVTRQSYGYASPTRPSAYTSASAVASHHIQSPDGIVSMQIPADWRARPPFGQNYGAVSPRGESFSCGKVDVFMDAASMRAAAQALQMKGVPPQQLAFLPRLVSAPLGPDQIVVRLLPQISGGAMQNVQIIGARRLPDGSAAIAYRYVLLPQRDSLSGGLLPPALMRESQVPMQAEIHIQPASGIPIGVVRTWSFLYSSVAAPQAIYSRNVGVYAAMFQSLSVNGNAVQEGMARDQQLTQSMISGMQDQQRIVDGFTSRYRQNSEQQLKQFHDFNTRTGNLWIDMAGQQTRVKDPNDPNWGGYVQWGSQPGNTRAVHCWMVSSDPVFVDTSKPTPNGCNDVVTDYR